MLADAVIAQSKQQRNDLWAIRDDIEGMIENLYPLMAFDVSLGIPQMDNYVEEIRSRLESRWEQARMVVFGHIGDGNIHICTGVGDIEPDTVHGVENIIYEALGRRGGVISAEHGIGLDKRAYLCHSRSPEEIVLMRTIKNTLDPKNILNPGKILESGSGAAR